MRTEGKKIHSRKVPDSYKIAAKICKDVSVNHCNVKSLIFSGKYRHVPLSSLYGMVTKTLQNGKEIDRILKRTDLLNKEPKLDPWLAKVLIAQLLSGRQLAAQCKPVETILKYADDIKSALGNEDFVTRKPKDRLIYARVNTLLTTVECEINIFEEDGWKFIPKAEDYETHLEKIKSELLTEDYHYVFLQDFHVPELLIFPPSSKIQTCCSVKNGHILLQDKASCLAAMLLHPEPKSVVLDMCAGPGMKTSYIAALMDNEGTVYAVERNSDRFETMNEILSSAGVSCVQPILKSAQDVTSTECPHVQYILLDPPCSGSGMIDRSLYKDSKEEKMTKDRLRRLHNLQAGLLRHALSSFPDVRRVVYSTCSVNREENEHVIEDVFEKISCFKLVDANSLVNGEFGVGVPRVDVASKFMYTRPETDYTNGFFMAIFERIVEEKKKKKNKKVISDNKVCENTCELYENTSINNDLDSCGVQSERKTHKNKRLKQCVIKLEEQGKADMKSHKENMNYHEMNEKCDNIGKRNHSCMESEHDDEIPNFPIKAKKKKKKHRISDTVTE